MKAKKFFIALFLVSTWQSVGQNDYTLKQIDSLSKISAALLYTNPAKAYQLSKSLCEASKK